jgi:ABC-type phosphate/phosphonate transport system substrate-binding protein/tRNA A-37 threonylcarbamoyl transferase component Bud32
MNEQGNLAMPTCAICGAAIPPHAPLGQCPICLMEFADLAELSRQPLPRPFGEYELLRQIGCGGMGVVYEARHTRSERRVALKMIRPDLASKRFLRRFLIEAEAAARLAHPNIIPIFEIKEDGTESFFTMAFIEGETLKDKIRDRRLGLQEHGPKPPAYELRHAQRTIAPLIATVARAVHYAHEHGVFHRDLKPANIILDRDGQPHVGDFGVAKIVREEAQALAQSTLTAPGAALGTPEYMAPEQASGTALTEKHAIAAADTYGLGAVLYELLSGRPPFRGDSNVEILQKVREAELKRPRAINRYVARDLETICLKCLEKNPNARYPSALAVAEDLDRWLNGFPIVARGANLAVRAQRWIKANPVAAVLMLALLVGLAISWGFVALLQDRMRTDQINKALERETYIQKINDWWALPAVSNMVIPSSLLSEIRDQKRRPFVEGCDVRLRFGMSVDYDPITKAYSVAPIIGELENSMGRDLGGNVFIDLHISKASHLEPQLLAAGHADFQRLDALSYVQARALDPGIVPVLIESDADEIVFCVSQGSPVTNLAQLAGKSLGLGDPDSAATVLAKHCLLKSGLGEADLKSVTNFNSLPVISTTQTSEFGPAEIMIDMREVKSGREALRHLLAGHVDAAVTQKRYFESRRFRGTGLRMIARFPGMPEVFVARSGLDPKVLSAFQNAMLSAGNSPRLGTLTSVSIVTALLATNDRYFDNLRMAASEVREQFECTVSVRGE